MPAGADDGFGVSDEDVAFVEANAKRLGFLGAAANRKNADDAYMERVMARHEKQREREAVEARQLESNVLNAPLPIITPKGEVRAQAGTAADGDAAADAQPSVVPMNKAQRRALHKQEKRKAKAAAAPEPEAAAPEAEAEEEPDGGGGDDDDGDSGDDDANAPSTSHPTHFQRVKTLLASITNQQDRIAQARQAIAVLSMRLVEEPNEHVNDLATLLDLMSDDDGTVASYAMLSLLAVFSDIAPGYRIQSADTFSEPALAGGKGNKKLSKDVESLRNFESALLRHYQGYVRALVACAKSYKTATSAAGAPPPLRVRTSVRCLGDLLRRLPHFNCTSDVLRCVVPLMCSPAVSIHAPSCAAVRSSLQLGADPSGLLQKECADLVANLVLKRACRVPERVLESLTSAGFDAELIYASPSDGASRAKGGGKKRGGAKRKRDAVDAAFAEADATSSPAARRRAQSLLLRALAAALLRVLRAAEILIAEPDVDAAALAQIPVTAALRGIARIGHLLDVAVVGAAMAALGRIAHDKVGEGCLAWPVSVRLAAVQASCDLLRVNGGALNAEGNATDYEALFAALYALLNSPATAESEGLVRCAQALLTETSPRVVGEARAAAFAKRLLRAALAVSAGQVGAALGLMAVARSLLQAHVRARAILDGDAPVQSGEFDDDAERPDAANGLAATLWELDALRRHVHPLVRDMAELVPLANTDRGAHQRLARLGGPGMRPVSYCGRFGGIAWTPDEEPGE